MVFFNYSAQQMAAKIVYYGPGLGGKTTNLQYIYDHTSTGSRGEMVSLQTDTDRTLFFDLLPINVGRIGGFDTRIQLYTVPGQVFYNATRRLVLKGVDGIVFVADSQLPMRDTNLESLKNLEENLQEVGLDLAEMPIVLQFNKQDLPAICSVDEMNELLNPRGLPFFPASAAQGQGIFETLTAVSKLTLKSVTDRLTKGSVVADPRPQPPTPAVEGTAVPPNGDLQQLARKILKNNGQVSTVSSPLSAQPLAMGASVAASSETSLADTPAQPQLEAQLVPRGGSRLAPVRSIPQNGSSNGHVEMTERVNLELPRESLRRARRLSMSLQVEDAEDNVLGNAERRLEIVGNSDSLSELLLNLRVTIQSQT